MWSAPCSRATSAVRSVEPSSITSTATSSIPSMRRGMLRSVSGRVFSSSRQGIWTTSFMRWRTVARRPAARLTPALHPGAPAALEPELGQVVEDGGSVRAPHEGGAPCRAAGAAASGSSSGGAQGGGQAAEGVVHGHVPPRAASQPCDLEERRAGEGRVRTEGEAPGVELHRPGVVAAVEMEAVAGLQARRARLLALDLPRLVLALIGPLTTSSSLAPARPGAPRRCGKRSAFPFRLASRGRDGGVRASASGKVTKTARPAAQARAPPLRPRRLAAGAVELEAAGRARAGRLRERAGPAAGPAPPPGRPYGPRPEGAGAAADGQPAPGRGPVRPVLHGPASARAARPPPATDSAGSRRRSRGRWRGPPPRAGGSAGHGRGTHTLKRKLITSPSGPRSPCPPGAGCPCRGRPRWSPRP